MQIETIGVIHTPFHPDDFCPSQPGSHQRASGPGSQREIDRKGCAFTRFGLDVD